MRKISNALRFLRHDRRTFLIHLVQKFNFLFPDKTYLRILFYLHMGYKLNLESPKSFNEKIQWLKLYNKDPKYPNLVDKITVKEYVAKKIGAEHIIPTIKVWEKVEDIDFDQLPNQFVLKTNNGGGGDVIVCKDKSKLDFEQTRNHLKKSLKKNIYGRFREWPYKMIKPKILAEQYMEDASGSLTDYKFHVFSGEPKICLAVSDRFGEGNFDYFDANTFEQLPFLNKNGKTLNVSTIKKPDNYDQMLDLARLLAKDFKYVRIDLYNVAGKIYFSEFTLYDGSGLDKFNPEKWDYVLGEWMELPPQI